MTLKSKLSQFIENHWDGYRPLLIALSGGPDSLILFQLLRDLKKSFGFEIAIAHVDHRWRPTSEAEAQILEQHACQLGIPFHLKTLAPENLTGNLEAACRMKRLEFFRELSNKYDYQAVLLGHHADDQAETVLKRIFEGVSLPYLTALRSVTTIDKLTLWRPLLNTPKKELLDELNSNGLEIEPVDDETNKDPRFLRARFRTKLLPMLTKEFGKEISTHLKNLSYEAQELNAYLDAKTSNFYSNLVEGSFGSMLDLKENISLASLEQKHLIRRFCRDASLAISREGLETAAHFLTSGAANKVISCGAGELYIDRHCLFALKPVEHIVNKSLELLLDEIRIQVTENIFSDWKVTLEIVNSKSDKKNNGWRDAWKGKVEVFLPTSMSPYLLAYPKMGDCYPNSSPIGHWWNKNKVPVFIRNLLPVIYCDGKIVHEFLSGRTSMVNVNQISNIAITLKRN